MVACGAENRPYRVDTTEGGLVLKTPEGGTMCRYVVGPLPASEPQTSVKSVGYLHPVCTPAGRVLTQSQGGDHGWLRGVFVSWMSVTGAGRYTGFWTGSVGQFAKQTGVVVNRGATTRATASEASLTASNAWIDGEVEMLREETQVTAALRDGVHVIDVAIRLTSVKEPITLRPWAFAGFTFHGRRAAGESVAVHGPEGEVKLRDAAWNQPQTNWPDAAWYDLVTVGKDGTACGLAVIAHPDNGQTTWNITRGLRFVNSNVTATAPRVVSERTPLTLRYRLVAHDGGPPPSLGALRREFAGPATEPAGGR
jgi:hypothetical protein